MIPKLFILSAVSIVLLLVLNISGKPVAPKTKPVEGNSKDDAVNTGLEYDRYLREVVSVLEEDEDFRKKLEAANVSEIKDGSIARNLEFVGDHIRTKLDEIKRREVERLQELARLKLRSMKGAGHDIKIPGHLDVMNPHSFEMKDLENLIKKTTSDLEELDKQRRDEFKEYEMEKQYQEKEKLDHLTPEERKKEEERLAGLKKKHAQHEKVNHPASKDQFEEVWENKDHLDKEDFDPKTFFKLHDTNSDGLWEINEVEALLQVELDKVYSKVLDKVYGEKDPEEDNPVEKYEEMNRMREHIFTEIDTDNDHIITEEEFLAYTGPKGDRKEFEENEEWKTLENQDLFDDKEYQDFIKDHHQQQINQMPHDPNVQNMNIPQGSPQDHYQQQIAMQQQQIVAAQQQAQAAAMQHQQQMAQQHAAAQQQMAQQQFAAQQQQFQQQQHQQGVPVQQQGLHGQQQQQQQPAGTVVQGQVPVQQQQMHQQQVPVQQQQMHQQQVPVQQQQQMHQQQVPVQQQQMHQQQVPVHQQQQQVPVQQQQQVPVQQQQVPVQQHQQVPVQQNSQPVVNQV